MLKLKKISLLLTTLSTNMAIVAGAIVVFLLTMIMTVSMTHWTRMINASLWVPDFLMSVEGDDDGRYNPAGEIQNLDDVVCVSECCDPFSSHPYKQVMEDDCTRYRLVTIPDDRGRLGHGMAQAYILMVFLKLFEQHKNATGRGKGIVHIPVLPRYTELLLCGVFVRPRNMYTSHDLLRDVCGLEGKGKPVGTTLYAWKDNFDELVQKNIELQTWPMPVMYLKDNKDVYQRLFNLYPAWERQAKQWLRQILNQQDTNTVVPTNVTFIAVHVRQTDYIGWVEKFFPNDPYNESTIEAMMDYANIKYKNALFLLFSDDENWCRKKLRPRSNLVMASPPSPELSLAIMKQCNVTIVTYGSFGLWAGILGGGPMIRLMPRSKNKAVIMLNTEETLPNVEFFHYPQ